MVLKRKSFDKKRQLTKHSRREIQKPLLYKTQFTYTDRRKFCCTCVHSRNPNKKNHSTRHTCVFVVINFFDNFHR